MGPASALKLIRSSGSGVLRFKTTPHTGPRRLFSLALGIMLRGNAHANVVALQLATICLPKLKRLANELGPIFFTRCHWTSKPKAQLLQIDAMAEIAGRNRFRPCEASSFRLPFRNSLPHIFILPLHQVGE